MSDETCSPDELAMIESAFGRLTWGHVELDDETIFLAIGIIAEPDRCRPGEVEATEPMLDALGKLSDSGQFVCIGGRPAFLQAWRYGPGPGDRQVGDVDFRLFA